MLVTDATVLRDELGRQVLFHGINLVRKGDTGARAGDPSFRGDWTSTDLDFLAGELGINLVRLAVIWAAAAPAPGVWDEPYLAWLGEQLDELHARGMVVVLDAHQDLYSQQFSDGAPQWATLTEQTFDAAELWSDGYLRSPAVHESLDAFWSNAEVAGRGLQDHLTEFWLELLARFGNHPAVIGIDVLNEPTPGSEAPLLAGHLLGAVAAATGQDLDDVMASWGSDEGKLEQLAHLDDVAVHRAVGDQVAPALQPFDEVVQGFYDRVWWAVRAAGFARLLLREHTYFSNTGVPSLVEVGGDQVVYSPHGYDLVVDTDAVPLASNTRAETIFTRAQEAQQRWQVPVIVGEWGAFGRHVGVTDHGTHLLDLFDRFGWSHTYWCWERDFADTEAARVLRRSRPRAVDGTIDHFGSDNGTFTARWTGAGEAESAFWLAEPGAEVTVTDDQGAAVPLVLDGRQVTVEPRTGSLELRARW
ncbi:glycoside hydrolase family 5 protein [Aestuariimicrobium ganziense]|uniref:glycoside hydrolase family 5 protein n=1 Tax=Aestuariimicrobium ganziense TaxID=2773677 RepID=UPI0019445D83|nr:cellulase family glycosylhydrolase [Aestuariimicrobium ganziense]